MASIFYEYIQGDKRDNLIQEMELDCEWRELSLMLEMVQRQSEINEKRVELKVLKESGSYEDYGYLLEAGEQQATANNKNLLQRIFEWFAKFFNNLSTKFNSTKQVVSQADPNAVVQVPEDYANDSEINGLTNAADALSKASNVKTIVSIATTAVVAGIGGYVIYNKTKAQRESSNKKNVNVGQLTKSIPGLEKLLVAVKAAEAKAKAIFEKEPNAKSNPNAKQDTYPTSSKTRTGNQTAAGNNGPNLVSNAGENPAPAATPQDPTQTQSVLASAYIDDIYGYEYLTEGIATNVGTAVGTAAAKFMNIAEEVVQNPKVILTYLQKMVTFISEKLDWIKNAASSVMSTAGAVANNTNGPIQNAAANVANTAAGVAQTAQVGQVAANVAGAVANNSNQPQPVTASANVDSISDRDKLVYESVFGEKFKNKSNDDIIMEEFSSIFKDL
mgnify:CR=1 FL=1